MRALLSQIRTDRLQPPDDKGPGIVSGSCRPLQAPESKPGPSERVYERTDSQRSAIDWHWSRGRKIGVTRCPDDRGAGVNALTPDLRVRKPEKREDGRERGSEEPDADDFQTD
ncbi:hypothetical protein NDU88_003149 [Pleurodeles waltl]|uniref:Uncharacterized protein n=1 Tax=Pleurodeles waltl TaxID=8319 RepID=A0AAV7V1M0_PLEWA|nr:hypothetical protein NDU88_003149 [Pleurodeles waltl]